MSLKRHRTSIDANPTGLHLPFALPIVEAKKKKKCCKKYKKGKRCKKCPKR